MTRTKPTVLLVEDDDVDAMAVERAFRKQGSNIELERVVDGQSGLDRLREMRADENRRIIVLLDLNMPRMNGIEFLAAVREDPFLSPTIVFVLTTSDEDRDVNAAYAHDVAGYLCKGLESESMERLALFFVDYFRRATTPKTLE